MAGVKACGQRRPVALQVAITPSIRGASSPSNPQQTSPLSSQPAGASDWVGRALSAVPAKLLRSGPAAFRQLRAVRTAQIAGKRTLRRPEKGRERARRRRPHRCVAAWKRTGTEPPRADLGWRPPYDRLWDAQTVFRIPDRGAKRPAGAGRKRPVRLRAQASDRRTVRAASVNASARPRADAMPVGSLIGSRCAPHVDEEPPKGPRHVSAIVHTSIIIQSIKRIVPNSLSRSATSGRELLHRWVP